MKLYRASFVSMVVSVAVGAASADPTVYLHFDVPGDLGLDSSASGNNANLSNSPGYTMDGVAGGALDLTANQSYLRWTGEENPVEDLLNGDFTFSLWIKSTQSLGTDFEFAFRGAGIIYADVSGTPTPPQLDATPLAMTGSRLTGLAGNDSLGDLRSTGPVNTGEWFHVAVRRTVGETYDLFINGELNSSVPTSTVVDLSGANSLTLGGNTIDSRYFNGLIDEFRGYDYAVSDEAIRAMYLLPTAVCPGDIADDFGTIGADGMVSFGDFLALLGLVGPCPGGVAGCTGDIADDFGVLGGDAQVSFGDFLALLGLVGPCP